VYLRVHLFPDRCLRAGVRFEGLTPITTRHESTDQPRVRNPAARASETILRTIVTPLVVPVTASAVSPAASASQVAIAAACPILHFELGPLDLDLLGQLVNLLNQLLDVLGNL
jgi:hypothetical protein